MHLRALPGVLRRVTTPYCSGLSLLLETFTPDHRIMLCNHPLLFGTVSPTHKGETLAFIMGSE